MAKIVDLTPLAVDPQTGLVVQGAAGGTTGKASIQDLLDLVPKPADLASLDPAQAGDLVRISRGVLEGSVDALSIASLGGGGGGALDFVAARLSATSGLLNAGAPGTKILFDVIEGSRGSLGLAAGDFTGLQAGKLYELSFEGRLEQTPNTGSFAVMQWWDETANVLIGGNSTIRAMNASNNVSSDQICRVFFAPLALTSVSLRCTNTNGPNDGRITAFATGWIKEL